MINLFSLNFTSIEIEGERERVSSSKNERTLGGGGFPKMNKGEQRGKEGQTS